MRRPFFPLRAPPERDVQVGRRDGVSRSRGARRARARPKLPLSAARARSSPVASMSFRRIPRTRRPQRNLPVRAEFQAARGRRGETTVAAQAKSNVRLVRRSRATVHQPLGLDAWQRCRAGRRGPPRAQGAHAAAEGARGDTFLSRARGLARAQDMGATALGALRNEGGEGAARTFLQDCTSTLSLVAIDPDHRGTVEGSAAFEPAAAAFLAG